MDGWIEVRAGGRVVDGWVGAWADGWRNGWIDGKTEQWMGGGRGMEGRTDGRTNGQRDRLTD